MDRPKVSSDESKENPKPTKSDPSAEAFEVKEKSLDSFEKSPSSRKRKADFFPVDLQEHLTEPCSSKLAKASAINATPDNGADDPEIELVKYRTLSKSFIEKLNNNGLYYRNKAELFECSKCPLEVRLWPCSQKSISFEHDRECPFYEGGVKVLELYEMVEMINTWESIMENSQDLIALSMAVHECVRYFSFKQYLRLSKTEAKKYSQAGFFFIVGSNSRIVCPFCNCETCWSENEDPVALHRKISPTCAFINGEACGNHESALSDSGESTLSLE